MNYKLVWEAFEPVYDVICQGSRETPEKRQDASMSGALKTGTSRQWLRDRRLSEIFSEEIKGLFDSYLPGQGPKEKKIKADIYSTVFETRSATRIDAMKPEQLREGKMAIEYLLRHINEKGDFITKLQEDRGKSWDLAEYLAEVYANWKGGLDTIKNDDIPIFSQKDGAGNGQPDAPPALCMDDILLAIGEQTTEQAVQDLVATHAAVISKLAPKERKNIEGAILRKIKEIGKTAKEAETAGNAAEKGSAAPGGKTQYVQNKDMAALAHKQKEAAAQSKSSIQDELTRAIADMKTLGDIADVHREIQTKLKGIKDDAIQLEVSSKFNNKKVEIERAQIQEATK
jgi:hypothetical protein